MDTLITILIVAVIAVLVRAGLKETIKHAKGEGACCGRGNSASDDEPTVILSGKIVTRMNVYIDGMHCMNCKNSVTRSLQKLDQVSAKVDLKKNMAYVESTRNVGDDEITFAIERLDFNVTRIEHIS